MSLLHVYDASPSQTVSRTVVAPAAFALASEGLHEPLLHMPLLGSQLAQHAYTSAGMVAPVEELVETFPEFPISLVRKVL